MKILLVHQNFPGQFRGLAPALVAAGHQVHALSMRKEDHLIGIKNFQYSLSRQLGKDTHPWLRNTEAAVIRGMAAAEAAANIAKKVGVDLVLGHTGWGEMLFLRQAIPQARILGFNELYYQYQGGDVNFDPEFPASIESAKRLQVRNMHLASSLMSCDEAITPTKWQAQTFPPELRANMHVIHDGIRTDILLPNSEATVRLRREDLTLKKGDEIITFINRNLEPMRGYHQFMRALPQILSERPKARVIIVGGDAVSYGAPLDDKQNYKQKYLHEVKGRLDISRVHFVGRVPYDTLTSLLKISAAHVYLTVPFVLSWSMMEAMSLGALVIGSDTAPVKELIQHGQNGLLVDFFNPQQLASTVCDALANQESFSSMRKAARKTIIKKYDFNKICLPRYLKLIEG